MNSLVVLGLLAGQLVPTAAQSSRAPEFILAEGRVQLRQGLLEQAEASLRSIPESAPPATHAAVQLLLGNIAFERGQYAQADAAWASAQDLYERAARGSGDRQVLETGRSGAEAAKDNRELSRAELERARRMQQRAAELRYATLAAVLMAAGVVFWGARRSPRGPANLRDSRPHR